MHHHDPPFKYCPVCGDSLQTLILKDNEPSRLVCTGCGFVLYLDPKVVACTLLELDGGILLLRRAIEPQKGKWVMPGGYVDRGEEVRAAAMRETEEECGLKTRILDLLGVYSYTGFVPVVVVYRAEVVSGDLIAGDETAEAKTFRKSNIPWQDLAFRSTGDAVSDYLGRKK